MSSCCAPWRRSATARARLHQCRTAEPYVEVLHSPKDKRQASRTSLERCPRGLRLGGEGNFAAGARDKAQQQGRMKLRGQRMKRGQ